MTDSKNIVIKVKYAAPDAAAEFQPKMITEWNIKRIAGAAGVLLLLLGGAFWWWSGDSGETDGVRDQAAQIEAEAALIEAEARAPAANVPEPEEAPVTAESTPVAASAPLPSEQASPAPVNPDPGSRVRRATLAYRIIGKEPADLIGSTIRVRKGRPLPVYYFTEVRGKSGQNLFHEWRKNGRVMLRHPITIDAERWRATSQRELDTDDRGSWSVRTVDQKGRVMNQIEFTVSAK